MDTIDFLMDVLNEGGEYNTASVPRVKKFAKEHPGVIATLRAIKSKDKLDDYISKIKSKEKLTEKEIRYLTDLWQAANRDHSIWDDIKAAGVGALSGAAGGAVAGSISGPGAVMGAVSGAVGGASIFGISKAHAQWQNKRVHKRVLSMAEVSLFIEDFRNLYNSALDLMYEYSNEEMPIEKVITYNEAAYILNNIL